VLLLPRFILADGERFPSNDFARSAAPVPVSQPVDGLLSSGMSHGRQDIGGTRSCRSALLCHGFTSNLGRQTEPSGADGNALSRPQT
jgi:hypothetical protein